MKIIKDFIIPHSENDYNPHILREFSVVIILCVTLSVFVSSLSIQSLINKNKMAAIYTAVLVDLTNSNRVGNQLPALTVNTKLEAAANAKAQDMAKNGYFAHNSPTGLTPWYWIKNSGYDYLYAGENLAVNFTDSSDVENAWMNSPDHRANILNNHFTDIGIGMANGMYEGREVTFVVQEFGSPQNIIVSDANSPSLPIARQNNLPVASDAKTSIIPKTKNASVLAASSTSIKKVVKESVPASELAVTKNDQAIVVPLPDVSANKVPVAVSVGNIKFSHWYDRLLTNPSSTAKNIYISLGVLVLFAVSLCLLLVEWRSRKYKNILYGSLLLIIIFSTLSIHYYIFASQVLIG